MTEQFTLYDHYQLAKIIDGAAEIKENSWIEAERRYGKSLVTSISEVTKNEYTQTLVWILLEAAWNDSLDWANRVIESVDGPRSTTI